MNTLIALLWAVVALAFAPQQFGDTGAVSPADCPPWPLNQAQHAPPAKTAPYSYAPFDYYADTVVGATDVINPGAALGPEDFNFAHMTASSALTLSFPGGELYSGITLVLFHDADSTCDYLWMTIKHYADLMQTPIYTTYAYTGIYPGGYGIPSERYLFLPFHRYVVVSFNTDVHLDAVYYLIKPRKYWMPVVSRSAVP